MSERARRPWLTYALGALCVAAVAVAYVVVGPASQTAARSRTVLAQRGVVQSTVSGSGNIEAASELDLGFKTSGTVTRIYARQGEHVTEGRLLAELDPEGAEVALEQARASLQAAEASLVQEEESNGESSSSQDSAGACAAAGAAGAPKSTNASSGSNTSSSSGSTLSEATREANIASARAAVKSDRLTVRSDEQTVANTKLYAPQTGTMVALNGEVGETVSARGTTKAGSSGGSSASSGSGASGGSSPGSASASVGSASGGGSSSSGDSSSSTTSAFAVLSDLSSMRLVVALSESEIGSVRVGQPATVTIEALEGRELSAHVVSVATLPTSSSGVVSYDATFQLDQQASGLKPGMSATAEVVVKQAEGVNVPTSAISGGVVTVVRGGKQVRQSVVTGLAGANSTILLSGVSAGERVVLPIARATSTSGLGRLGGRSGAGGLGGGTGSAGGGAGGLGGGAGIFFRGAGG
jgi:multidrug efflux pump subunit AcrA (membrane-fusion protein)